MLIALAVTDVFVCVVAKRLSSSSLYDQWSSGVFEMVGSSLASLSYTLLGLLSKLLFELLLQTEDRLLSPLND